MSGEKGALSPYDVLQERALSVNGEDVLSIASAFNARDPMSSVIRTHKGQPCFAMRQVCDEHLSSSCRVDWLRG